MHAAQAVDGVSLLLSCPHFEAHRIDVEDTFTLEMPQPHSFMAMMCVGGEAQLQADGLAPVTIGQGETALIPAVVDRVGMTGPATLFMTTVPTTKN
jgi:mannose-6-phosphate isomerase class I